MALAQEHEKAKDINVPNFGGLILAGGKSSRMGKDKALLCYEGRPLLDHMKALLAAAGASPVLVAGRADGLPDKVPDKGPVGGICALGDYVSQMSAPASWLVAPVDMPMLTKPVLRTLLAAPGAAAYFAGHPLPAVLRFKSGLRPILHVAARDLAAGRSVSMRRLLDALGAVVLPVPADSERALFNANTPEDWASLFS